MSRVGSTITESDSKILNGLFNPYQWYTPTVKALPRFDDLINLGVGGKLQQGQQGIQQQAQFEQQNQQSFQQQMQPQVQFEQQDQSFQQQGLQQQMQPQQQSYQQPLQQQMQFEQKSYQQPLQQQVQQPLQQQMQFEQQYQQPLQQQVQQPLQQQVQFEQQKSFQQPLQQQMQQPLQQQVQFDQQSYQQPLQQQVQQPLQQQMQQPFKQQMKFEQPQVVTQISEIPLGLQFSELPETVYFEISEFERKGGKGYEYKHKGKRIPISEGSRMVSVQQGNLNDWQLEAKNCIDKILQLNNKGYNRINQLENFRFNQGFSNQNDVNNWISRLKRNLDMLVKENERLRAELDSGNFGKMGGIQGGVNQGVMQGGVNMGKTFSESVDSSSVIRPSEIKKAHYSSEKIGQWHPQEKQTFTEKVKDTAFGIATTVENVALHPIDSVGKLATTVEQVALHPIQSVEKAADAVVHTVM